jgi:hypothetical protein
VGWKKIHGRSYYYQSRRAGGRVHQNYVPVSVAPLVAQLDAYERERKEMKDYLFSELKREKLAEDALFAEACDALRLLARAELLCAGYHQHKRSWRKRASPPND